VESISRNATTAGKKGKSVERIAQYTGSVTACATLSAYLTVVIKMQEIATAGAPYRVTPIFSLMAPVISAAGMKNASGIWAIATKKRKDFNTVVMDVPGISEVTDTVTLTAMLKHADMMMAIVKAKEMTNRQVPKEIGDKTNQPVLETNGEMTMGLSMTKMVQMNVPQGVQRNGWVMVSVMHTVKLKNVNMTVATAKWKNLMMSMMIPVTVPLDVQSRGLVMAYVTVYVRLTNVNKTAGTVMMKNQ